MPLIGSAGARADAVVTCAKPRVLVPVAPDLGDSLAWRDTARRYRAHSIVKTVHVHVMNTNQLNLRLKTSKEERKGRRGQGDYVTPNLRTGYLYIMDRALRHIFPEEEDGKRVAVYLVFIPGHEPRWRTTSGSQIEHKTSTESAL